MNAVVFLAEQLGRERPLTASEQRVVDVALGRASFRRWSAQEDATLLRMHKAKLHSGQMAITLGRTADSIRCRLRDLKKQARVK